VEAWRELLSLFLLCFIEVSHPGFIARFHFVARCSLDACSSLQLLDRSAPTAIPLNPAPAFFSCSSGGAHLGCRTSFLSSLPELVLKMSWDPVFRFVQRIPRGRVLTYGALAKALRLPGGARSAGRAMAATPSGKGIPWHRVIGERGKILIREPYASLQRKLLESEGVTILESRVDLKRHLWKPPAKSKLKQRTRKKRTQK